MKHLCSLQYYSHVLILSSWFNTLNNDHSSMLIRYIPISYVYISK